MIANNEQRQQPTKDYPLEVAKLLQQERPDPSDLDLWPEPWAALGRAGIGALDCGQNPRQAIEQAIELHNGDRPAIRTMLYAASERLFREPAAELPEQPRCPALPEGAQPDPALGAGAGAWVDLYANYAAAISPMTPRSFHESAALWLGAVAIARRLKVPMAFGDVFPNIWAIWLAPTTLYRKSTALDVAHRLARRAFAHLMAAQDTTPEAFLSDLAGNEPTGLATQPEADKADWLAGRNFAAQKGWILDELSGLLAAAGKDYNAGLVESLLRFYDCTPFYARSTRGQGRVVVHDSYLSLLGASTPGAMTGHLTADRLWSMGWWPRFAVLTPDGDRPAWQEAREQAEPPKLAGDLQRLYNRLPIAKWPDRPGARAAILGTDVHQAWNRYNKALSYDLLTDDLDERLHGTYGRLPTQALKVALILAALDLDGWPEENAAPAICLPHLARAISICECWRASAHRALTVAAKTDFGKLAKRVIEQVTRREPQGATLRDIYRAMQDHTPADIQTAVMQLVEVGELEELAGESGPKGGRPTKRYRVCRA